MYIDDKHYLYLKHLSFASLQWGLQHDLGNQNSTKLLNELNKQSISNLKFEKYTQIGIYRGSVEEK